MLRRYYIKDAINIAIFIVCVFAGTFFINAFVFRSFSVVGPSMEKTLYTGDRLVVNRLPVTWSQLRNENYVPERGQVIVFKNPHYTAGIIGDSESDEYIVKRVIAFPGEHVVLSDGHFTVYNDEHPEGFDPDDSNHGEPGKPTAGSGSWTVPVGELFVSGDHRQSSSGGQAYSYDSRNGLGTIPFYDVVGPVILRLYPFDKIRTF